MILHRNQKSFFFSVVYKGLKKYICIYKKQKGHSIEENQQRKSSFFHLFKELMQKFVTLPTKEKGKATMNEWETMTLTNFELYTVDIKRLG